MEIGVLAGMVNSAEPSSSTGTAVSYTHLGMQSFSFTLEEERSAVLVPAGQVGTYLYEPNASVLKAGAFKQIAVRTGVKKLQVNSHLYTSDHLVSDFPGRRFRVDEVLSFTGKLCKGLSKTIPQANITVRNFPLSVEELRKRTKITDGGHVYLFATTLVDGEKVLVKCCLLYTSRCV